jgi:hypothetical protein
MLVGLLLLLPWQLSMGASVADRGTPIRYISVLITSCVYLNTGFNAQQRYSSTSSSTAAAAQHLQLQAVAGDHPRLASLPNTWP